MGAKFYFSSQTCTSPSQSERLVALGLDKETADRTIILLEDNSWLMQEIEFSEGLWNTERGPHSMPTWSLHRLVMLMPKSILSHSIGDDSSRLHSFVPKFDYLGVTIENVDEILADFYQHTNLYDNLIDCIEWLINNKHFDKKYLA